MNEPYREKSFKNDIAILTLEEPFNFRKLTRRGYIKKGFHTLKSGILGDFNPKGKVYFHHVSLNICAKI